MTALLTTAALAQDNTQTQPAPAAPATTTMPADSTQAPAAVKPAGAGFLASNIIGESVYNGTGDQAQNIGDVNDVVISNDGAVQSVVVGVGGFLGIGEKNVAVDWKQMSWAEQNGDRWLVMPTTKEALQALPDFDRTQYEPAPATASTATGTAPADDTAMAPAPADTAAPADQTTKAPAAAPADQNAATTAGTDKMATAAIDKSTLSPFDTSNVRAEDLVGATVYGANDENVGEIGDVVLTQDGKVDSLIIDVGGFLGIGEKEVAIGMEKNRKRK